MKEIIKPHAQPSSWPKPSCTHLHQSQLLFGLAALTPTLLNQAKPHYAFSWFCPMSERPQFENRSCLVALEGKPESTAASRCARLAKACEPVGSRYWCPGGLSEAVSRVVLNVRADGCEVALRSGS